MLDEKSYQSKLAMLLSVVGVTSFFIFGLRNLFIQNVFLGAFEIAMAILGLANFIVLYFYKNTKTASIFIILIMYFSLITIMFDGGINGTGILWFFTFPPLALFLYGKKGRYFVFIMLITLISIYVLQSQNIINTGTDIIFLQQLIPSFVATTLILYFFTKQNEERSSMIREKSNEIDELSSKLNLEIERHKTIREDLEQKKRDAGENRVAMLNIVEDLEEEKKASELQARELLKFQQAVESASDQIVITDTEGKLLYANPITEKITGYSIDEVMGTKAGTLWGGLMDEKYYKTMWDTIKNQKKAFEGDIKNKRKDGTEYDARINISPVFDNDENIIFFIGIERDITKEKQIDTAKTEFVSLASHQLRTPLTSINWYAELLSSEETGKLNEEQKQYLDEIMTGSKRMVELVNSLLNVSRIELGTFAVEPAPTDLIQLLRSVLDELKLLIDQKEIKIISKGDNVPTIPVDTKLFRIVYQNLLTNAVKYTPEQGTITIVHEVDDKLVRIKISDTGYGIPKDQQDKIFTKLFRADNVREKDTQGTGLGLYIIKSIITQSDGKIWFESKENEGTTFFIELPITGMKKKEGSKPLES